MPYLHTYLSPVGQLFITSDGTYLTGVRLEGQKYFPTNLEKYEKNSDLQIFKDTTKWLDMYFKGKNPNFTIPTKAEGTPFRKEVWKMLSEIPYGETTTYGEIAENLAKKRGIKKMSARGVGGAVGHNPISLIVPCHRVL
ncbi:methylated-DNA--protein-cysteine methyltransferase [Clostridia bacterium]|nr:methylated-DNA--protein-cysteine methyltransferase [Clostridia bacterium]